MPRHPHCLHASAAFWPVNSLMPQPDHPELAPFPFTQTHYETETIQVPEAHVSIPAAVCTMPDVRGGVHACLQWLETHVRVPLAGSAFDRYIATPAKEAYCGVTKQR